MNELTITEDLVNKILRLPKKKIIEVQDFVEYLNFRSKNKEISTDLPGFSSEELFSLRQRLSSFAEDWESKDMDIYDKL